ncbi:PKD-like family lipoprotein [Pinibacter soli]|uniref:PKD-like family lipoprotein n=1 Tax=Pinibacter soli TaxID=3044211 RepID=A0ABT6RDB2_9BACT|nr:PKD-like family lipoprotein [Pinibacter soli]MDI3320568.1 PKD-like family lipoprotein [Pinibacter soli]
MKKLLIIIFSISLAVAFNSCYKDKGNYTYDMPEEPVVTHLDTVYKAVVGDSLIITPTISVKNNASLSFDWRIGGPNVADQHFSGSSLRMLFGLGTGRFYGRLTVINNDNGMHYFHDFKIDGVTNFSLGTAVLSVENNVTQFSFIKPDGAVQARIYAAIQGENLPAKPLAMVPTVHQQILPVTISSYWVLTENGGVQIGADSLKRAKDLTGNFFNAPDTTKVTQMSGTQLGVITGVINHRLYAGFWQTWNRAPIYGMFGVACDGDYTLDKGLIYASGSTGDYYIGYDAVKKNIIRFNVYGQPMYFGTQYSVIGTAFDPTNVGLDLVNMMQVNKGNCFLFGKSSDGTLYELKFSVNFTGPFQVTTLYKRAFSQPSLITENTKFQATDDEMFYFNSGSKVYRYNPTNQNLTPLTADFGGKNVTMIKLVDQNTLVAGVEGSLYYLNISTGKNGDLIKKIDGIPGSPVDIAVRAQ